MSARARLALTIDRVRAARAELVVIASLVVGWALLTHGIAAIIWRPLRAGVWPISAGLALLSLFGWKMLGGLAWGGLYPLIREDKREGRRG